MARDFGFWKNKSETDIENNKIYRQLSQGQYLHYLCDLPINQIVNDFCQTFCDWSNEENTCFRKDQEEIQLYTTEQFVRVDCYNTTEDSMNMIIDIMLKHECPLYDSAIDIRFD